MKKSSQKAVASKSSLNQSLILTLSCSLISSFFLLSCSGSYTKAVDQASQSITDSLGCANVQSKVFDAFYSMIDQDQLIPQAADLKLALDKKIDQLSSHENNLLKQKNWPGLSH